MYPARFDCYSPYFLKADEYGLDLHPYDYYELIFPFSQEAMKNLACYFMDHNSTADYFVATAKRVYKISEKVQMRRSHWNRENGSIPPRLFFQENGRADFVYDSRTGEVVEHEVGEVGSKFWNNSSNQKESINSRQTCSSS